MSPTPGRPSNALEGGGYDGIGEYAAPLHRPLAGVLCLTPAAKRPCSCFFVFVEGTAHSEVAVAVVVGFSRTG